MVLKKMMSRTALTGMLSLFVLLAQADSTIAPPGLNPSASGRPIGEGQSWYPVGRAKGAWYTNGMGRPIMVTCSVSLQSGGNNVYFYLDSQVIGHHGNGSSTDHSVTFSYIIPAGSSYMITGSGGRTNIDTCAELY